MSERLVALIVDEANWLPLSMAVATVAVMGLVYRQRGAVPTRRGVLAAMTLFFGVTIGTMAFGHLLAVTTKLASGTLGGSAPLLYGIGAVLVLPSVSVIRHTRQVLASDHHGRATIALNAWLAVTLLALGVHNLPLAVPGALNVGYHLHSRRVVGWAILGVALTINVGLFVASLIFMASGQNFEQFTGID